MRNPTHTCCWVPQGLEQTRLWGEASETIPLKEIFSGTVATKVADGLNQIMCRDPIHGDISCTADKSAHGYWSKDKDKLAPGEIAVGDPKLNISYTLDEMAAFRSRGMYFWQVRRYDPSDPPTIVDASGSRVPAPFGSAWFGEYGQSRADLRKGDRIYVRLDITNRHRLAYYLAVEHTKQEIAKLYAAADGVKVGGLDLRDVFKMDAAQLAANGIDYTQLFSKQ